MSATTQAAIRALDVRIERLEEVAERWDVPGGSRRLAQRARDKAEGIRAARRILTEGGPGRVAVTVTRTARLSDDLTAVVYRSGGIAELHLYYQIGSHAAMVPLTWDAIGSLMDALQAARNDIEAAEDFNATLKGEA